MEMILCRRAFMQVTGAATIGAIISHDSAAEIPEKQPVSSGLETGFDGTKYVLPKLPYAYDALEPACDAKTLELHYTKHHAASINSLNSALVRLAQARHSDNFAAIKELSEEVSYGGSGHVLHTLFWHSMTPGGSAPSSEMEKSLIENFGSVAACKAQFAAATKAVEGSGWGLLVYEPIARKLLILQVEKHQNLTIWGVVPLLTCDVWEHAYYLKYKNDRAAWVEAFMTIADWRFASHRLAYARSVNA